MRRRSLTLQLTLLFAAASTLVLVSLGLVLGQLVHGHFEEQDFAELDGKLEMVRRVLSGADVAERPDALARALADALTDHRGLAIAVAGPDGAPVYATPGSSFPPGWPRSATGDARVARSDWRDGGREFRVVAGVAAADARGLGPYRIAAALDLAAHESFMGLFNRALWVSVALAIAAGVALGWIAARRGMAPLREVTRLTETISADRLAERLPEERVPAELAPLAASFNAMLERLEDSFRRLSDFSSDLAHEMRTPITNLMTQTQVALSRPRGAEEYREVLYSNLEEFDRLARIVEEMLFLAKSEHGLVPTEVSAVDFAAEADALLEFFEALAAERDVRLAREGAATGPGDRLMVRRALGNLLSNAIRHATPGGTVTVSLGKNADGAVRVAVENPGPEIAAEHRERIFDRFYRADASRGPGDGGAGLGLAITQAIVRAHGGTIALRSDGGFTRFEMTFPPGLTRM